MTIQEQPITVQSRSQHDYNDEIDLRVYLDTLIRWWREIVLITLLSALAAGGIAFIIVQTQQPQYEATATAVIARVSSDVNFDERFLTTAAGDAATSAATSRRAALVGLVKSGVIAQAVIDELGAEWVGEANNPFDLLNKVKAGLGPSSDARNPSDLIRITVTADNAEKAADIANAWSRHYVNEVNSIYGQVPPAVIASVQEEQVLMEQQYLDAQTALETFIGISQIDSLSRQLETDRALLETLKLGQINAASAVIDQDLNARLALFNSLVDAEVKPSLALLEQQTNQNVQVITDLLATRSQIQQALGQTRTLQAQVSSGGDAAATTNALALQLLKAQIFASTSPTSAMALPNNLQINIDAVVPTNVAEQQADIDALIIATEGYLQQIDDRIALIGQDVLANDSYQFVDELTARGFSLSSPPSASASMQTADEEIDVSNNPTESSLSQAIAASYANLFDLGALANQAQSSGSNRAGTDVINDDLGRTIGELEKNVQLLAARLEGQEATQRQLTQQRDLTWTAYETLNNKVVELSLARSAADSEVRLGAPAIPSTDSVPGSSVIMALALGGVIGFIFAVFLAFFATYMGKEPFLRLIFHS